MGMSNRAGDRAIGDGVEAYIGVPLVVGAEDFGTLSFSSREPHRLATFTADEVDFVRSSGGGSRA